MTQSDRPNPPVARQHAAMVRLLETPRYWRGQASMARRFAEEAYRRGHWRAADRLHGRALSYGAQADALLLRARHPDAPSPCNPLLPFAIL